VHYIAHNTRIYTLINTIFHNTAIRRNGYQDRVAYTKTQDWELDTSAISLLLLGRTGSDWTGLRGYTPLLFFAMAVVHTRLWEAIVDFFLHARACFIFF
jgi:hypothetical protein